MTPHPPGSPDPSDRPRRATTSRKATVSVVARPALRQSLAALLERHGHPVLSASESVVGGALRIMEAKPEVMVLDVGLPDGSGVDFCRDLTASLPDLRVVLLGPTVTEDLEIAALAAGASAVVELSVSGAEVLAALAAVTGEADPPTPGADRPSADLV